MIKPVFAVLMLIAAIVVSSPIHEDAWNEIHQQDAMEGAFEGDLLQSGWGKPKSKTVRMDIDMAAAGGVITQGICLQASVPTWIPTSAMNTGMNMMWNTKIGKKLEEGLSKHAAIDKSDTKVEEASCDRNDNPKAVFDYTTDLPFVGALKFHVFASNTAVAGMGFNQQEEIRAISAPVMDDLVQQGWGSFKVSKKTVSMDLDVSAPGGIKGSICFQGSLPSYVPNSVLSSGMKLLLKGKIVQKMKENDMEVTPDDASMLVATGDCDRKENPNPLLEYSKDLPFIGATKFAVYGSSAADMVKNAFRL